MRADGVPTQHMRSLVYWMAAPELDGMTSMQVCGTEWVSHVTCRRKLMNELTPRAKQSTIHPTHDIFNGMVSRQKRAVTSSEGALLIDELTDWLDARSTAIPRGCEVRRQHPAPERIAAQVALGYFLPYPVAPSVDFDPAEAAPGGREPRLGPRPRARSAHPRRGPRRQARRRIPAIASRSSSRSCTDAICASPSIASTSARSRVT